MLKRLEEFIQITGDGLVLDYINGCFVLENKSFVEGNKEKNIPSIQGAGPTVEICIDNFLFSWENLPKDFGERSQEDEDLIETYSSY